MRAIRLTKPGLFEQIELPEISVDDLGPDDVLVKVCHVGLCGTDIHAYHGRQPFFDYPRILGHELGVKVVATGSGVKGLSIGQNCSVEAYLYEPGDRAYDRGMTNCTTTTKCLGVHVDGAMRDFMILPADKLQPSHLPTRSLALVEPLCIGYHAVERARAHGDELTVVMGMGPIGLGVATFARLKGLDVVAVDISEQRLEAAGSRIEGLRTVLLDPDDKVDNRWGELKLERPEIVWDCTGNKQSMEAAIGLSANGGKVVFVGIYDGKLSFSDPDFHRRELDLLASRNATKQDFKEVIRLMEAGKVDPDSWINHECKANDFTDVLGDWLRPESGLLKGVICFEE